MTVPAQVLAAVRSIPHPRQEPDMNAPHPSPAEQAEIDRFGMFDEEETVERVARAMWDAAMGIVIRGMGVTKAASEHFGWNEAPDITQGWYRTVAAAAIAVMPVSPAEEAARIYAAIDAELQDAPAPNYEEDDYAAGYIEGLTFAAQFIGTPARREAIAAPH